MSRFTQGPRPDFDSRLDLRENLLDLFNHEPTWPPQEGMMTFARDNLNVAPEDEDEWYRSAWWGYYACRLLEWHRRRQGVEEILNLIEPIDWSPLDSLFASNTGVILTTSHLGPGFVPGWAITESDYPMIAIRGGPAARAKRDTIPAQDEKDCRQALAKALLHLRRGNIVLASPEGSFGNPGNGMIRTRFLNQKVKLHTGIGELARVSKAQTCWFSASWVGRARIKLIIQHIPTPQQEDRELWLREWYVKYLNRMAKQVTRSPRDIGFQFGLWGRPPGGGGVLWYEPQDETVRNAPAPRLALDAV